MRCKKIRHFLPLLAGSELPESKVSTVESHLDRCPLCQEEYEKYVLLVQETRKWLAEDRMDWKEREWQEAVQNAVTGELPRRTSLVPWPFPKTWAFALMAGAMLLITILVVRPPFVEKIGLKPRYLDVAKMEAVEASEGKEQQEVISMTMVSKETGLKIVWFFNKNFDLEERK
ncbi:MAG: hypothetical protein OEY18_02290 [Candidatus Aminicenantes bacterium]|jgi:hypothetical protein|nr:hypothetical protein [Candidatus Aminicenantes bacterium]MDH5383511.1 hypothetical protein [Candidatus Aminicenantes bacterium]MDH5744972.1 hypothetical protein [Candidatus Aminicenantes bacterium]